MRKGKNRFGEEKGRGGAAIGDYGGVFGAGVGVGGAKRHEIGE